MGFCQPVRLGLVGWVAGSRLPIASAVHIPVLKGHSLVWLIVLQPWLCRTAAVAGNRSTTWGKGGIPSKLWVSELAVYGNSACSLPSPVIEVRIETLLGEVAPDFGVFEMNDPFTA